MSKLIEFKNFFVGSIANMPTIPPSPDFDVYANGVVEIEGDTMSFHVDFNDVGLFFNLDKDEEWVAKAKQSLYEIWADKHYIDGGLGHYVRKFPDRFIDLELSPPKGIHWNSLNKGVKQ